MECPGSLSELAQAPGGCNSRLEVTLEEPDRLLGGVGGYLLGLRPRLPAAVWTVVAGGAVSALGNGFVLPYGSIYLHVVRGIPIPVVGALLSFSALASLLVAVAGGTLVDRLSPKAVILLGLGFQTLGFASLGFATGIPQAALSLGLVGLGAGCFYPALGALLAAITTRAERAAAASLQYAANNLGIGLGAIVGGLLVSTSRPGTFTLVYLLDAATFVVFAAVAILRVPSGRHREERVRSSGYVAVLRDWRFMGVVVFNVMVVVSTYSQLDTSVPLYARVFLRVPTAAIGLILAANTGFIVLAQLPLARLVRRVPRTQTLTLCGAVWSACWMVGWLASLERGMAAAAWLGVFAVTFGAGECLLSATLGPLVADLARPALRGRYMATFNLSWAIGLLVGPSLGGVLVGSFLRPWMWLIWAMVAVGLALWASLLTRWLPEAVNLGPSSA